MILISVMLILCLLVAIVVGSAASVHNDYRMASNLRGGTAALYLAESGIEWAKGQIGAATSLPLALNDQALSLSTGNFATVFAAVSQPGPLTGHVVVRASGSAGNAAQTVQAGITKRHDLGDGALVLRGDARAVNFTGTDFVLDGRDHELVSRAVVADSKPAPALSVGSVGLLAQANAAANETQLNNFVSQEIGRNAIARSSWLGGDALAQLANGICGSPAARSTVLPALTNLAISAASFGSRVAPEIRCFEGPVDSSSTVTLSGSVSGAGIMVARNLELVLSGEFVWEGLVLVTGRNTGFRTAGSEQKEILGTLMVNETGNLLGGGPAMVDIQGSLRLLYSRQGHDLAAALVPTASLQGAYSHLPYRLKQDYWRIVTP